MKELKTVSEERLLKFAFREMLRNADKLSELVSKSDDIDLLLKLGNALIEIHEVHERMVELENRRRF